MRHGPHANFYSRAAGDHRDVPGSYRNVGAAPQIPKCSPSTSLRSPDDHVHAAPCCAGFPPLTTDTTLADLAACLPAASPLAVPSSRSSRISATVQLWPCLSRPRETVLKSVRLFHNLARPHAIHLFAQAKIKPAQASECVITAGRVAAGHLARLAPTFLTTLTRNLRSKIPPCAPSYACRRPDERIPHAVRHPGRLPDAPICMHTGAGGTRFALVQRSLRGLVI